MSLVIVPISLDEANAFVATHHRHHRPAVGHKFSIAVVDPLSLDSFAAQEPCVCGVVIVGRPVARGNDDGLTLEVTRCCTDGTRNACSALYGAAWRAARALGYRRLITYTLPAEGGASLRGAGWRLVGARGGGNWNTPARPRIDTAAHLRGQKLLWEAS
ncbi:XF1762 family protein [Burkholderia gladioli]|uniref:XF1762 family protein n=1 Tax=Burkholderia gladioli TaxID=28095 RepID=UPI00163F840D|nr:XF1762 family protein [Burkholderia gladioli]